MLIIIACAFIGFYLGLKARNDFGGIEDVIGGTAVGLLVGCCIAMLTGLGYSDPVWVEQKPVPLESLVDGASREGNFFLGSGVINDVSKFTWYERSDDNSYVQNSAYADDSVVHFVDADEEPYYIKSVQQYKDGGLFQLWGLYTEGGEETSYEHYDFFVPRGSITKHYELDAE
jgi:hypothetical protein